MSTRLITHFIHKNQRADKAVVQLRDSLNVADDFAAKFLGQLRAGITQKNPSAGKFRQPMGEKVGLQVQLGKLLNADSDDSFVVFTKKATAQLSKLIEKVPLATGGYVVFAQHNHGTDTFLLILILSTKAQVSFNQDLELTSSPVIDLEHLRHAARFNLKEADENPDGVVQFVSRESGETANYFLEFLACEKVTDSEQQGRLLYSALSDLCKLQGEDFDHVSQVTFSYWGTCRRERKPMQLTTLANLLRPDDPNSLLSFLADEKYRLAGEFSPPAPHIMKRFVKFSYSKAKLKIEFDKESWLGNITTGSQSITIRKVPVDLIEEILAAKKEG